jgi:hypothetical protein
LIRNARSDYYFPAQSSNLSEGSFTERSLKAESSLSSSPCFQHQQEVELSGGIRELELGYHHDDRDFAASMPFTFRVQPSHPNLQQEK